MVSEFRDFWILQFRDFGIWRFRDFVISNFGLYGFGDFVISEFRDLGILAFRDFWISAFRHFGISGFHDFVISLFLRLRDFGTSSFQDFGAGEDHGAGEDLGGSFRTKFGFARFGLQRIIVFVQVVLRCNETIGSRRWLQNFWNRGTLIRRVPFEEIGSFCILFLSRQGLLASFSHKS